MERETGSREADAEAWVRANSGLDEGVLVEMKGCKSGQDIFLVD